MPCPACKVIIDGGYALKQQLDCMSVSILLNADDPDRRPTKEHEAQFHAAAEALARVAAEIEQYVSGAA